MPPGEPPALRPDDSAKPQSISPKPRRSGVIGKPALFVLALGLVAAFAVWSVYFSPRAIIAEAVNRLENQTDVQLTGTLDVSGSKSNDEPASIRFKAEKQSDILYLDGTFSLTLSSQQVSMPAEILVDGEQNSYLKLRDSQLSDMLIRNSNPDSALKLLNADAVFNTVIKDKWLRLTSKERKEIYRQPFAQSTFNILPAQPCLATLLDGDSGANTQLIKSFTEIMVLQGVHVSGEDNIDGHSATLYEGEISSKRLEEEWGKLLASSNVKAFNECVGRQPGMTVPSVKVSMWIEKDKKQLSRVRLVFDMQPQSTTLDMSMTYDQAKAEKSIPDNVLTLGDLNRQIKASQGVINDTFRGRLAAFPELSTLVNELKHVEDLRQGL